MSETIPANVKTPWLAFRGEVPATLDYPDCSMVQAVEQAIQGKECNFSAFVIAAVRAALEDLEEERKV